MKRITAILLVFIICISVLSPAAFAASRDTTLEQDLATDLKSLSLFKGVSDTDFALDRAPTRTEAIVMLIRVLGKEGEVTGGSWSHPFTDVASWANNYVGYAYQKGLTKGTSSTEFGTGNATAATYLTLVLRALGYSDTNGADFTYDNPYTLAESLNILPGSVNTANFLRADVVLISYSALPVTIKGTSQTLSAKLIADGVFTQASYKTFYDADAISSSQSDSALSAEQVYSKCSPAVFYIEVYDSKNQVTASGSGFFIDSNGTAITNYHVIEGAYSAKITVSNTEKVYKVTGVYDYNVNEDWAVLKIDGTGFSYLKTGATTTVVGGATVYALGSPLGLQNTISEGIISNPKRALDGVNYIQISAAISSGSSGGALINKYGEVVGITSASYVEGQNLNLAVPMTYLASIKTSTVTSLSSLAETGSNGGAYDTLRENLKSKGVYSSKHSAYELDHSSNGIDYSIFYFPDDTDGNDLMLISYTEGDGYGVSTVMYIYEGTQAYYDVLVTEFSTEEEVNGYDYLTSKSFNSSTALYPSEFTGAASGKSGFGKFCTLCVCDLLEATNYMLTKNSIPLTIKDLGFDALYTELAS